MASSGAAFGVYKRPRSPFWWIWVGSGAGRKFESSKKRQDDPLGWKQAFDMAREKAGGAISASSSLSAMWDSWVDDWIRSRFPDERQKLTLDLNLMHWRFTRAFLGAKTILEPKGVTYALAMEYFAWRQKNRRHMDRPKVQTAVIELELLRRVMSEAVRRSFIVSNPLADMMLVKPRPKEKPEISPEEETLIRDTLAAKEGHLPVADRWMTHSFIFAIRQGWRIAETSFPMNRVNFAKWEVLVHSKGDKWRTVPIHPELKPILTALKAAGAKRSLTFPDNNPKTGSRLWSNLLRGCDRDNIVGILPHLCHHCCRVTLISRLARAGVGERVVMEFVGHWSTTSHRIYSRVAHGDLARCILPDDPPSAAPASPTLGTEANGVGIDARPMGWRS